MNGDVTDWIRGTPAGALIPDGMQIIYDADGTALGGMFGGKWYGAKDGGIAPPKGVGGSGGTSNPPADPENKGWDWGKVGDGFNKMITDPLGSTAALATNALAPWIVPAALLGVAAIIFFIALQSLLKSGEG